MTRFVAIALMLAVAGCARRREPVDVTGSVAAGDYSYSLRFDGRLRRYILHVPPGLQRGAAPPILLAFHGGGGNAKGFKDYAGLDEVSDREGFLVAYPDGTGPLRSILLTWNSGGCCGWAMQNDIDDVGFAMAVVADVNRRTPVDQRRIYATGHSNGAMMSYRLAAEQANRIAAIAPVAGAMMVESFAPAGPVPVMHIHSIDDPRALYDGGLGPPFPGTNNRVDHEPVQAGLDRWIGVDGCPSQPVTTETRTGRPGRPDASHTATRLVWSPCNDGAEIVHWRLTGAGHGWPGGSDSGVPETLIGPSTTVVNAAEEVWAFVSRFSTR